MKVIYQELTCGADENGSDHFGGLKAAYLFIHKKDSTNEDQ